MNNKEHDCDVENLHVPFRCWCGSEGFFDDMFDYACLDDGCGGTRSLNCYCGGDQCVCHHHGETECQGCGDCLCPDEDAS